MTREHKLALIVGFSLILLVGVLISDHLSSARQAQVGEVGPGEIAADVGSLTPIDPLRTMANAPAGWTDPDLYQAAVPPLPSPIASTSGEPLQSAGAPEAAPQPREPVIIGNGPEMARRNGNNNGLVRAIVEAGGEIINRDGIAEFVLPPAAQTRSESARGEEPAAAATARRAESPAPDIEYQWHTVQRNETLYQIASRVYGDGNLWRTVAEHNSDRVGDDGSVRAGVRLRLPPHELVTGRPAPVRTASREASSPRTAAATQATTRTVSAPPARSRQTEFATYTVRRGDTLGEISQRTLGTARRWREIAELNQIENANQVRAGQILKIPVAHGQG